MALDAANRSGRRKAPARKKPQGIFGQVVTKTAPKPTPRQRPVFGPPTPKKSTPAVQQQVRVKAKRQQAARTQRTVNLAGDRPADYRRGSVEAAKAIKAARLAHLRNTRKQIHPSELPGILQRFASKELHGRGVLAKVGSSLASHVEIRPGGVKMPSEHLGFSSSTAAKVPKNIVKDALNFPAQAIPSLYLPAKAGVQAAGGNTKPLKKLAKDFTKTDPVFNLAAAGVAKLEGKDAAAAKHFKVAKKQAEAHPGFTLLETAGVKGTIGRGAGRTMRSGALGKGAKRAASIQRKPRTVEGTGLVEHRQYSKDVFRKVAQVQREKSKRDEATALRHTATQIEDRNPERAVELRRKAARVDPDVMPAREIRRRVDERVDANETIRREHRGRITHQVAEITEGTPRTTAMAQAIKRKAGRPTERTQPRVTRNEQRALSLVAQNITHASKADMAAYLKDLEAEAPSLDRAGRAANKALQRQIRKVIDGKIDPARVRSVASDYEKLTAPLQKGLVERGLLDAGQAERAALIPYAVRRMGAHHDPEKGIVNKAGEPISTAAIKAHMKAHDVPESAFLTQAPNMRGGRNFNIRSEQPQQIRTARRTGESTRKGTFDAHPDTLTENAAKAQGLIDAVDGFRSFVGEFSVRRHDGKPVSHVNKREADRTVDNLNARPDGVKYRAIRVQPFGARKELLDQLLDQPDAHQIKGFRDLLDEALDGKGDEGPWAIIPESAADQLQQHLRAMGPGSTAKAWQAFNSLFRQTVLATSPTWLAGNVLEATMRTGIAKAGPRSYLTGKRVLAELKRIDPQAADEAMARTVAGGHFSFAKRAHVRRDASQFQETPYEGMAQALGKLRQTPGPKQAVDLWNRYTDFVFNQFNGKIEAKFQTAMVGKAIRESGLMDDHIRKLSHKAVQQAAQGMRGTNEQVALGRAVDRMYGAYGKFSPTKRMMIAYYTPFVAWSINAVKFVTDVLPRDHPTATALIAASEMVTQDWRKQHGLDLFMNGAVPGFLQGTIPISGGRKLPGSRYTPFGFFGDPLGNAAGSVLPQVSGILAAFKGEDWKGTPIRKANGQPGDTLDKARAAMTSAAEATIPVLSLAQRVHQKGPKALNPFNPIAPAKDTVVAGKPDAETAKLLREVQGSSGVDASEVDKLLREVSP